jgi:hypothetical protein
VHTPTFFINVVRLIGWRSDFTQVKPHPGHNGWNDWCFATKRGHPYIVVAHNQTMFSIGRVRSSRTHHWKYRVFWPFGSREQQVRVVPTAQDVVDLMEEAA